MKLKIYVVDFEVTARVKIWGIRLVILALALGAAAVAMAAGPLHVWATGDSLQATDLNGNFSNLAGQISAIQGEVHPPSGFHAWLTNPTSVPTEIVVPFNHVEFDSGAEYNPLTGVFTAKQAGVYLIVCAAEYSPGVAGVVYYTIVLKNGVRLGETDVAGASNGTTPEHTMIAQLAANDAVSCKTGQETGATASLHVAESLTQFSVARLY